DASFGSTGLRTITVVLYVSDGDEHEMKYSSSTHSEGTSYCSTATYDLLVSVAGMGPSTVGTHPNPTGPDCAAGFDVAAIALGIAPIVIATTVAQTPMTRRASRSLTMPPPLRTVPRPAACARRKLRHRRSVPFGQLRRRVLLDCRGANDEGPGH